MSEQQTEYKVTMAPFFKREKDKHQALLAAGWEYNGEGAEFYKSPANKQYYAPAMAWYLLCQMEYDEV